MVAKTQPKVCNDVANEAEETDDDDDDYCAVKVIIEQVNALLM